MQTDPDFHPRLARSKRWALPAVNPSKFLGVLLALLALAYVAGWLVGQEQERDLQKSREQACEADPHCLRP